MYEHTIGWDIGGAHLKVALIDKHGIVLKVIQLACPLWKGINELTKTITQVTSMLPVQSALHAITMTGELVDLFDSRKQGVEAIIQSMKTQFGSINLYIYSGNLGFLTPDKISNETIDVIASANWLASASMAAQKLNDGLFIDIGSTTTDILALKDNKVHTQGLTDYARLVSEELVYTGIIRTPIMAISKFVEFNGNTVGLMAEHFATMADVFRVTEELNEIHDLNETADGSEKTCLASARRLARMIGCDFHTQDFPAWRQLAKDIRSKQLLSIRSACERQLSRSGLSKKDSFIGAGVGRFLAKELANQLGHPYIDFSELFKSSMDDSEISVGDCAPAVSVGYLVRASLNH